MNLVCWSHQEDWYQNKQQIRQSGEHANASAYSMKSLQAKNFYFAIYLPLRNDTGLWTFLHSALLCCIKIYIKGNNGSSLCHFDSFALYAKARAPHRAKHSIRMIFMAVRFSETEKLL